MMAVSESSLRTQSGNCQLPKEILIGGEVPPTAAQAAPQAPVTGLAVK